MTRLSAGCPRGDAEREHEGHDNGAHDGRRIAAVNPDLRGPAGLAGSPNARRTAAFLLRPAGRGHQKRRHALAKISRQCLIDGDELVPSRLIESSPQAPQTQPLLTQGEHEHGAAVVDHLGTVLDDVIY